MHDPVVTSPGKLSLSRIAIHAVLLIAVLLYLVPLVVMLLTSFKTPEAVSYTHLTLPTID